MDSTLESEVSIPFVAFLEQFPVNTLQRVSDYFVINRSNELVKLAPVLNLWCPGEGCRGYRRFDGKWSWTVYIDLDSKELDRDYLVYTCRDCISQKKTFCLMSFPTANDGSGRVMKVGEFPELHIDLPTYLPTLLGDEYEYFIKGMKCEKQGFGIAAFSYYRRVVEKQKGRMFEKMADAAAKLKMPSDVIAALRLASKEEQFSKAIDNVKDHIPESFKVDGHNPMKILHSVLSDHLHERTDEECLATAQSVRIVIQDMSTRIKAALRDDAEARGALSELMKRQARQ